MAVLDREFGDGDEPDDDVPPVPGCRAAADMLAEDGLLHPATVASIYQLNLDCGKGADFHETFQSEYRRLHFFPADIVTWLSGNDVWVRFFGEDGQAQAEEGWRVKSFKIGQLLRGDYFVFVSKGADKRRVHLMQLIPYNFPPKG